MLAAIDRECRVLALHAGAAGVGKSHLLDCVLRRCDYPVFATSGPALLAATGQTAPFHCRQQSQRRRCAVLIVPCAAGQSELQRVYQLARSKAPSVLILDDLDIIV